MTDITNLSMAELRAELARRESEQPATPVFSWKGKEYTGPTFKATAEAMRKDGLSYNAAYLADKLGFIAGGCLGISLAGEADNIVPIVTSPAPKINDWTPPGWYVYRYRGYDVPNQQLVDRYIGSGRGTRAWSKEHGNTKHGKINPDDYQVEIVIAGLPDRATAEGIEAWQIQDQWSYNTLKNTDRLNRVPTINSYRPDCRRALYLKGRTPLWADRLVRNEAIKSVFNYSHMLQQNQREVCPSDVDFDNVVILTDQSALDIEPGYQR